jgi:hypothetical protein
MKNRKNILHKQHFFVFANKQHFTSIKLLNRTAKYPHKLHTRMPSALRTAKAKEKKEAQAAAAQLEYEQKQQQLLLEQKQEEHPEEEEKVIEESTNSTSTEESLEGSSKEALHKLVYDYLLSEDLHDAAKGFLRDVESNAAYFKALDTPEDSLDAVYRSFMAIKHSPVVIATELDAKRKGKKKGHDLLAGAEGGEEVADSSSGSGSSSSGSDGVAKKKRKRATAAQKKEAGSLEGGEGSLVMKEESQKQYTFGWKRYAEYCQLHGLDTMVAENASPATQILEFARYLMQNSGKTVKSAVANSYVSAVGKRLLEASVITAMRDIRTPELKELFAEAGRAAVASAATSAGATGTGTNTTIATASTAAHSVVESSVLMTTGADSEEEEGEETKKKKRV